MINRKVIDISRWNRVRDWQAVKNAGIIGVIAKATEGVTVTDITYASNKAACDAHDLLFGAYHFVHPHNVAQQVEHFLSRAGLGDDMLYALDWEQSSTGTMHADEAKEFISLLEQKIGINRTVIYSGNVAKEMIHGKDPFFGARRLWLAQYGPVPHTHSSWDHYWLWQYSDGSNGPLPHGCPGVAGQVDTNHFDGTDDELKTQWSGKSGNQIESCPSSPGSN